MEIIGGTGKIHKTDRFDPFEILKKAGGWYECPKDSQGNWLGPLVGYTARDLKGQQFVGREYVNFSKLQENPNLVYLLGSLLADKINGSIKPESWDTICAVPEGGKIIGAMFALFNPCKRYIYPDKEVKLSEKQGGRGTSVFTFGRHRINPGDQVVLVEDVVNNFTSVTKLCKLIFEAGGRVVAIASFFNRSEEIEDWFLTGVGDGFFVGGYSVPVISLIRKEIRQYCQDDRFVADDVKKGNVVLDPKKYWGKLVS